jgi:hypothetical protein
MLTTRLDITFVIIWSLTLGHVIGALICLSGSRWLAMISTVRHEILLPIILSLVFVAAHQGNHDWGDFFTLVFFGAVGWIMKRLGWPRPPMVLGLVIGGIFERYLFISTELYGTAWLTRPIVLVILALVAWALYRPLAQIVVGLAAELRTLRGGRLRFDIPAAFTTAVIALIVAAIVAAQNWSANDKLVPLTASWIALIAAVLNLANELFGRRDAAPGKDGAHDIAAELGVSDQVARWRATVYFLWLLGFIAVIALIGFIPAIALFVFVYMRFGFGEPWRASLGYAAATTAVCWLVFDRILNVTWPHALIGELVPALRTATGVI